MSQFNPEAEKMLLGCILTDSAIAKEISLKPEQVSVIHKPIFEAIQTITKNGDQVDPGTLYETLGMSFMTQIDLNEMVQAVPSPEAYKTYESTILRAWKRQKVRDLSQGFLDETREIMNDEQTEQFIDKLNTVNADVVEEEEFDLKNLLFNIFEKAESGESKMGLPTGFTEYDNITSGHKKGELIIVGARPSVGKTAFALNMASGHLEHNGFGHLYSLEMGEESFVNRMISATGRVDSHKMMDPKERFDDEDWNRFSYAIGEIGKQNMNIVDKSSIKISEIYARTRKLMRKHPDKDHFVIIDYLQLLQPVVKKNNRQEEVSEMSRSLKIMARDLNIPIIVLSQLSRGVESRQDKRPMLSDLRESGSIEQDADIVAFLYRDDYYNAESENKDIIEIIVAKQREGPIGTAELAFIKEYNLFTNLHRRFSA
ncbi:replicative DNA helicase [Salipaludibacillus sp. CF4.18]|uniref:replicative DNA helicase n=1 Tax=Salipaludibacillus sp. CF4.18 TaxID=3373081 RepID=UPI003EE62D5A